MDLNVKRGEVMGLVETNGSGKTTTIRMFMGFVRPTGVQRRFSAPICGSMHPN